MALEATEMEDEKTLFMAIVHAFFQRLTRPESLKGRLKVLFFPARNANFSKHRPLVAVVRMYGSAFHSSLGQFGSSVIFQDHDIQVTILLIMIYTFKNAL